MMVTPFLHRYDWYCFETGLKSRVIQNRRTTEITTCYNRRQRSLQARKRVEVFWLSKRDVLPLPYRRIG